MVTLAEGGRKLILPRRRSITRSLGEVQMHFHFQFWSENHEECTPECILIGDKLMISLYQPNPHDNAVRKYVSGRAVMGMLLGLFHEFGLNFLSPGDLVEQISGVRKCIFGGTVGPYFFRPVKTL